MPEVMPFSCSSRVEVADGVPFVVILDLYYWYWWSWRWALGVLISLLGRRKEMGITELSEYETKSLASYVGR